MNAHATPASAEQRHHNNPPPEFWIEYERPYLYPKQFDAIFDEHRYSLIEASTKAGKAQPLDSLIYTPKGPKRMGDIRVGDQVLAPGGRGNVIGVYPQGEREILRVTFGDGAIVEADAEHLWEVHQFNQRPIVITTEQLQTLGSHTNCAALGCQRRK